jgi:hypothetical protein
MRDASCLNIVAIITLILEAGLVFGDSKHPFCRLLTA